MSDSERNERPEESPESPEAQEKARPQGESEAGFRRSAGQGAAGEGVVPDGEPAQAGTAEEDIAALQRQVSTLKDQLLRALAEAENVRTRMRREREEALRYAAVGLVRDLLPVADNLRRALESVPAESLKKDQRLANFVAGIEMTEKALQDAFAKHQIRRIDALGEKLDPHRHEAMVELEDPDRPSGTVAAVYEVGYQLHDRLVRPARVAVAKGGPAGGAGSGGAGDAGPGTRVDTEA